MTIQTDPQAKVIIRPLGPVPVGLLRHLARSIHKLSLLSCEVDEMLENPAYAWDSQRDQYCCRRVLQRLERSCSPSSWRVLGVTEVDLFMPILKYVYGASQLAGRCAVISLHRLRPQYYGDKENEPLLWERAVKTALHELGHSVGLTHCRRRQCVMYSSWRIQDTDAKLADFCPTCRELFKWNLEKRL